MYHVCSRRRVIRPAAGHRRLNEGLHTNHINAEGHGHGRGHDYVVAAAAVDADRGSVAFRPRVHTFRDKLSLSHKSPGSRMLCSVPACMDGSMLIQAADDIK